MANRLRNAGFLEQAAGYEATGSPTVDTSVHGAPGRAVLSVSQNVTAGQPSLVRNAVGNRPSATAGQVFEISALAAARLNGAEVQPKLQAVWVNTSEVDIATVPLFVRPVEYSTGGVAHRGLPQTFYRGFARLMAPPGSAKVMVQAIFDAAAAGVAEINYLKPFIAFATGAEQPQVWDPGSHSAAALNLAAWPSLRSFRNPPGITPVANRTGFQSATGVNKTRLLYREPPVDFRGQVRCTPPEADQLLRFHREGYDRFWIVRPDTDELCVATWLPDGAPKPVAYMGLTTIYEVGLQLSVA